MADASLSAEELAALRDAGESFGGAQEWRRADLAAPDRQVRRRLPALEQRLPMILRPHRSLVSTELRMSVDVTFAPPEVASPARMAAEVTRWQMGAVLRATEQDEPVAWIGLPQALAWHLVEVAYGTPAGQAGPLPAPRQLTAIERETLEPFLQRVCRAFAEEFHFSRLGATELMLLPYPLPFDGLHTQECGLILRAQVPMQQGTLPYAIVLLPKALEHLEPEEPAVLATEARELASRVISNVAAAEVLVAANLGTVSVPLSTLTQLAPGKVLWLEHNQSEPIELLVEGEPKFTAMPMQKGGAVGVAIVERIDR